MRVSIIAAYARGRVIGKDNALPWRLPADLRRFRERTHGKVVLMGRRTLESIGGPLPSRTNLVLSRDPAYAAPGCVTVGSLAQALDATRGEDEIFVIGGAEVFGQLLPLAERMYLTEIDASFEGDAHFPEVAAEEWEEVEREPHEPDARNPYRYTFRVLRRRSGASY